MVMGFARAMEMGVCVVVVMGYARAMEMGVGVCVVGDADTIMSPTVEFVLHSLKCIEGVYLIGVWVQKWGSWIWILPPILSLIHI